MLYASSPKAKMAIENEIKIMRTLYHPNVMKLYEIYENKAQIYLIIDLARGGSLETALKQLGGPVPYLPAKVLFRQILEGVQYIHENGYMHRDLKPANILFKQSIPIKKYGLDAVESNVLICDFGIASQYRNGQFDTYHYCGSPGYMGPEIFEAEKNLNFFYNEKCDIFSLGCIFYQMLTGKMLFYNQNLEIQKKDNMKCSLNFVEIEKELNGSVSLTTLLSKMLSKNPNDRPSCKEILCSKVMQVEYTENGAPKFQDFQKPKQSPLRKLQKSYTMEGIKQVQSTRQLKLIPIIPEEEYKQPNKESINKILYPERFHKIQQHKLNSIQPKFELGSIQEKDRKIVNYIDQQDIIGLVDCWKLKKSRLKNTCRLYQQLIQQKNQKNKNESLKSLDQKKERKNSDSNSPSSNSIPLSFNNIDKQIQSAETPDSSWKNIDSQEQQISDFQRSPKSPFYHEAKQSSMKNL